MSYTIHNNTWPSDVSPPWADGERLITDLCTRFDVNMVDVIPQFREYMKSAKVGRALASLLLIEHTVPISSAEAERGFSQMNIVATDFRSRLLVSNIAYPTSCLSVLMIHCHTCGILHQPPGPGCCERSLPS